MFELNGKRGFASDNHAGVHPRILKALEEANVGHAPAYGYDPVTRCADECFDEIFGRHVDVFYTFNGTGTNCLALAHLVKPGQTILTAEDAHILNAETGAPERITGAKLIGLTAPFGIIDPDALKEAIGGWKNEHVSLIKALSLTQTSDSGAVYTADQIRELCAIAHANGILVHMDGARIANAVAAGGDDIQSITWKAGVDLMSFGGTKNGGMFAEAVVIFNEELTDEFKYLRKSCGQLASKMRFLSAQFAELLRDGLWLSNAHHANDMAKKLFAVMQDLPGIHAPYEPQANELFAFVEEGIKEDLAREFSFENIGPVPGISRFVTSWDTQEEDIAAFAECVKKLIIEDR